MEDKSIAFLNEILGKDDLKVLKKAISSSNELKSLLLPRVVLSWIDISSQLEDTFVAYPELGIKFDFKKNEEGFTGYIVIDKEKYAFQNIDLNHLAASLSVALGAQELELPSRNLEIVNLGKSIDLLVKSKILKKRIKKDKDTKKFEQPGGKAKEIPPVDPIEPRMQDDAVGVKKRPSHVATGAKIFKSIKISKNQSLLKCHLCNQPYFNNKNFIGCFCLSELSNCIKTEETEDGFLLKSKSLSDEEFLTILESFKQS